MEIALLQTDIAWGDKKVNLEQVEQLMNQHPGAQLYVLPEMFATGFMVGEVLLWNLLMAMCIAGWCKRPHKKDVPLLVVWRWKWTEGDITAFISLCPTA